MTTGGVSQQLKMYHFDDFVGQCCTQSVTVKNIESENTKVVS